MRACLKLLLFFSVGFLVCPLANAKDLATYRLGDVAETDIITPVALDVVDTNATAALRLIKSQQYPSIFRNWPEATNVMARNFLAAFARARTNFLADVQIEFHAPTLDDTTVAAADFGRLVTVFGVEKKNFPSRMNWPPNGRAATTAKPSGTTCWPRSNGPPAGQCAPKLCHKAW